MIAAVEPSPGSILPEMKQARLADPYRDLDVIDSRASALQPGGRRDPLRGRRRHGLVVAARAARRAARRRAHLRPALLPAVPRVLRARPAALRRGPARGLPPAALREHGRRGVPRGRDDRVSRGARTSSAPSSARSSPCSRCSRPRPGSAPAARRTSSATCSPAGRSSPARSRRVRARRPFVSRRSGRKFSRYSASPRASRCASRR